MDCEIDEGSGESDYETDHWSALDDEEFSQRLAEMAYSNDDEWIPPNLRHKKTEKRKTGKDLPFIPSYQMIELQGCIQDGL